jgi:transcriptional regulator with XRE-family HTH domain
MKKIEDRVKLARKYAGLSQKAMAGLLGMSERTYQRYEADVSALNIETSAKIVEICKISPAWFLTGKGKIDDHVTIDVKENESPNIKYQNEEILKLDSAVEVQNEIAQKFEDYESVVLANEYLLNMEKKSPKDFLLAVGYLKGVSDSIDRKSQDQNDRRKRTMDWASPERRKKTAS